VTGKHEAPRSLAPEVAAGGPLTERRAARKARRAPGGRAWCGGQALENGNRVAALAGRDPVTVPLSRIRERQTGRP
jgi:hypothetical protein